MLWEPGDDLICLRTRSIKENFLEGKRERRWYSQDHTVCTDTWGSWGQPPGGPSLGPESLRHVLLQSLLEREFHFIPYSPGIGLQTSYKRVFFSWDFTFENLIQFSLTFIYSSNFQGLQILHFQQLCQMSHWKCIHLYCPFLIPYTEYLSCFHLLWRESNFPEICLFDLSFQSSGSWFD